MYKTNPPRPSWAKSDKDYYEQLADFRETSHLLLCNKYYGYIPPVRNGPKFFEDRTPDICIKIETMLKCWRRKMRNLNTIAEDFKRQSESEAKMELYYWLEEWLAETRELEDQLMISIKDNSLLR